MNFVFLLKSIYFFILLILQLCLFIYLVCMHVQVCTPVHVHMQRSEGSLQGSVLSFHDVGPRDHIQLWQAWWQVSEPWSDLFMAPLMPFKAWTVTGACSFCGCIQLRRNLWEPSVQHELLNLRTTKDPEPQKNFPFAMCGFHIFPQIVIVSTEGSH